MPGQLTRASRPGRRLGLLTGGGDCPGLNAAIRAVVKHACGTHGWEVLGIEHGFQGLVGGVAQPLVPGQTRGLLNRGGTILGASNRSDPFNFPTREGDKVVVSDVSGRCIERVRQLALDAVVVIGGDGTLRITEQLLRLGFPVVAVPKTIDNDVSIGAPSIGFQTAVQIATDALDRLQTTAESHDRVLICEVMGRYAGWIALCAGLCSGADVILIPELPYRIDRVLAAVERRAAAAIRFSMVVIAEGARPMEGDYSLAGPPGPGQEPRLEGAAARLAGDVRARVGTLDVRITVLGHLQRGGPPTAADRLLATRYGVGAVDLVAAGQLGQCVSMRQETVCAVSLAEAARARRVTRDSELIRTALDLGIELGDDPMAG